MKVLVLIYSAGMLFGFLRAGYYAIQGFRDPKVEMGNDQPFGF